MKAIILIDTEDSNLLVGSLEHILDHVKRNRNRITEVTQAAIVYGFDDNNCGGDVSIEVFNETQRLTCIEMQDKIKELYGIEYPLFIFKPTDKLALDALIHYEDSVCAMCSQPFINKVSNKLAEFRNWQEVNPDKVKIPD